MTAFVLTAVLLLGFAPFISTYAAEVSYYQWDSSSENVSYAGLSTYFGEYEGSFVLYDLENNAWSIHDKEHATLRIAPNSTYKIYDALFGLEEGVITPENSFQEIGYGNENMRGDFSTYWLESSFRSCYWRQFQFYFLYRVRKIPEE